MSWLKRIVGSVSGFFVGVLLVLFAVGLLFWNEGRAVVTAASLAEGAGAVVSAEAGLADPANEGRLVHVGGDVTVGAPLSDDVFGISAEGLRLVRAVEMYQWEESSRSETRKTLGGGEETTTTYSYSRDWSSKAIDSSSFHAPAGHENPEMPVAGRSFQMPSARLGAFTLGESILSDVSGGEPLPVAASQAERVRAALGEAPNRVHVAFGKIFIAADPNAPMLGDLRVGYDLVPVGPLSIVAKQSGSTFSAFQTKAGDPLQLVETGLVPADQMFAHAVNANIIVTWLVRGGGFLLLFLGFALVLAPLSVIADIIPIVGTLVGLGTRLIAFAFAIVVGSLTVAIAWFWYRPLVALLVLTFGALVATAVGYMVKQRVKAPVLQAETATGPSD